MRRLSVAPMPALWHSATAPRSQKQPIAKLSTLASSSARRTKVLSPIAPPPALSPTSAMTIGPLLLACTLATASLIDSGGWVTSSRRSQNSRPSCAASAWGSEEHTSELRSLMRISYAVFSLKKKNHHNDTQYEK